MSDSVFNTKQLQLLVETRLSWIHEFNKWRVEGKEVHSLWQKVYEQIIAKDASMQHFTIEQMRNAFHEQLYKYRVLTKQQTEKGRQAKTNKRLLHCHAFDSFERYSFNAGHYIGLSKEETEYINMRKFLLKRRFAYEADFQKSNKLEKSLIWQKILRQLQEKHESAANLNSRQIQRIFSRLRLSYKRANSGQVKCQRKGSKPFFHLIDNYYKTCNSTEIIDIASDDSDDENHYDSNNMEIDETAQTQVDAVKPTIKHAAPATATTAVSTMSEITKDAEASYVRRENGFVKKALTNVTNNIGSAIPSANATPMPMANLRDFFSLDDAEKLFKDIWEMHRANSDC